jgi:hypothetical protein
MLLNELFHPEPNAAPGVTMLKRPLKATLRYADENGQNLQKQVMLPRGTTVVPGNSDVKKGIIFFTVNNKGHVAFEKDYKQAVGL